MSLDVYLTMPPDTKPSVRGSGIFVRQDGQTVEISRTEWDTLHPDRDPVVVGCVDEGDGSEVYSSNITHNLGRMAREADLYDAMWRPDEHELTHARDLIEPLRDGLATLQSDPERFRAFNPENGWGDYEGLLRFTAAYLAACQQWPNAEVRVWR